MRGWWKDTGRLEDMLEANRLMLDNIETRVEGELIDSQVDGRVVIEAGARLERSTVRGPAIIGAGARLIDCYIGPYTAIGEGCLIERAEVEHSILLAGSSVSGLDGRMESSLLGRNVVVGRDDAPAARLPLHGGRQLGDRDPVSRSVDAIGDRIVSRAAAPADARRTPSVARPRAAGYDVHPAARAELDITDEHALSSALERVRPEMRHQLRRLDRRRRRRGRPRGGATRSTPTGAGNVARAAARGRRAAAARLHRLRLRRSPRATARTWSPTRPAPRSVYGASKLAGEQRGARGGARRTRSCAPRGCSARAARTSSTRCCAWRPRARGAGAWSTTRSAARPGRATWRRRSCGRRARRRRAASCTSAAGGSCSWNELAARDLRRGRAGRARARRRAARR